MSSTDSAEPIPERVVGLVDDVNDPEAKTRIVRVRDLVAFLTNTVGAVHVTERPERLHQLLWEHTRSATYITPDGQYTGPVMALIEVARVTRAALEPFARRSPRRCGLRDFRSLRVAWCGDPCLHPRMAAFRPVSIE
jgi:hypothetical protein